MQLKFVKQIGISHAVAIRHREVLRVAKISRCGSGEASPGHGERASVSESHAPILGVIDLVNSYVVGIQINREVAVHRRIVEKIRFNDFSLITKAQDESLKAIVRIGAHDVPEDRMVPYWHHRLRTQFSLLAQASAESAA